MTPVTKTITVKRNVPAHDISVVQGANGTVASEDGIWSSGKLIVDESTSPSFTITPDRGYGIDTVTVDGVTATVDSDDAYSYTVDPDSGVGTYTFKNVQADHTISATFKPLPTITVTQGAGGTIDLTAGGTLDGDKLYLRNPTDAAFTIAPAVGYVIDEVKADGTTLVDGQSGFAIDPATGKGAYTFVSAGANGKSHTLSATFRDAIRVSPAAISFENVHAKDHAAPALKTVTVYNDSPNSVAVDDPTVERPFAVDNADWPSSIEAHDSATFKVSAEGDLPRGEYSKDVSVPVGDRHVKATATLNAYNTLTADISGHGKVQIHDRYYESVGQEIGTQYERYSARLVTGLYGEIASGNTGPVLLGSPVEPKWVYLPDGPAYMHATYPYPTSQTLSFVPELGYKVSDIDAWYEDAQGGMHTIRQAVKDAAIRSNSGVDAVSALFFPDSVNLGPSPPESQYTGTGGGDIHLAVTFSAMTYDFTGSAAAAENGAVTVSAVKTGGDVLESPDLSKVEAFSDVTFTATPVRGYHVATLKDGSAALTEGEDYTIDPNTGVATYTAQGVTAVHTVTATFERNTFQVSFDAGAGVAPIGPITVKYGYQYRSATELDDAALPSPTHPKGYVFGGWWTKADGKEITEGFEVTDESAVDVGYAHTLHARWLAPEGTVTDESGSADDISYDKKEGGGLVLNVSGAQDEDAQVYIDGMLLKKGAHYDIEAAAGGGGIVLTIHEATVRKFADGDFAISVKYDDTAGTEVTATVKIKDTTPPATDTGKDKDTDTGKTATPPAVDAVALDTKGGTPTAARAGDTLGSIAKPAKKGYTFKGWYTKAKGGTKLAPSHVIKKGDKIYAQWKAKKFKVTYAPNKGKLKGKKYKTVAYNAKYGKLPKPTRNGYKFAGWYTKAKGGKQITAKSKVTILKNTKLYAHWKKK